MKEVKATALSPGHVLLLPFNKEAHITWVKVGRKFVNFKTEEHGPSRVGIHEKVLVQS